MKSSDRERLKLASERLVAAEVEWMAKAYLGAMAVAIAVMLLTAVPPAVYESLLERFSVLAGGFLGLLSGFVMLAIIVFFFSLPILVLWGLARLVKGLASR